MIELARKHLPEAKLIEMDVRELALLEGSYDAVVCGFVIPYLQPDEVESLIQDVHSKLNEGGFFYLSFVVGDPEKSGVITSGSGNQAYFGYQTMDAITRGLTNSNFKIIESSTIPYSKEGRSEDHAVIFSRK